MEREADAYEIALTKDKESAIRAMTRLNKENLGIPRSGKIYRFWYNSHPSAEERIEFFSNYED